MDRTLWSFLHDHPDRPVPYPWERIYDYQHELLYYYNNVRGWVVVDLRTRVNLGGGLFHESNLWLDIFLGRTSITILPPLRDHFRDQDVPYILLTRCPDCFYTFVVPNCFWNVGPS